MRAYKYAMVAMAMAALAAAGCSERTFSGPTPLPAVSAASFELAGEVLGAGGAPVAGVEITLSRGADTERRAVSDAEGKFRIAGLEGGDWNATLKCKGYGDRSVTLVVNGNLTISFDLIPAL